MDRIKLIDGCLPPHTECPVPDCPCTAAGMHLGKDHKVPFSCACLRGWAMTKSGRKVVDDTISDLLDPQPEKP